MVKLLVLLTIPLIVIASLACRSTDEGPDTDSLAVVTTSNISQDWVQRVGGNRVDVFSLVPAGVDPHAFQPGAKDITRIADADVVFSIGLGLEEDWLRAMLDAASSNPEAVVVLGDVTDPISIGNQSDHVHEGVVDPHFWFDPIRVKLAVAEIALTLTSLDPANTQEYRDNTIAYLEELDELHDWAQGILGSVPSERRVLLTSHDTLEYFAARYGYEVVGTLIPGLTTAEETSAKDLVAMIDVVRDRDVPAIFVENTTNDRLANRLAEEADVAIVSSLYTGSLSNDDQDVDTYLEMMRTNITTIVEALR